MADKNKILRNVYKKLNGLPLGFGIPVYNDTMTDVYISSLFDVDLQDTMREIRRNIADVEEDSYDELAIENRTIYYALCRYRFSSAIFFKFSTAVDGKTVDKSMIPKMIQQIIADYDSRFSKWRLGSASGTWNRSVE